MGRWLIIGGIVLVIAGLLVQAGLPLGRLPGDIRSSAKASAFTFR